MNWWLKCLKQYFDFKGRARRKEYWMFALISYIIYYSVLIICVKSELYESAVEWVLIFFLTMTIPSISVAVRRMHDVGKSGWFALIPIYNLILTVTEGERMENKYGPDPKADLTI